MDEAAPDQPAPENICVRCQETRPAEFRFCPQCGSRLAPENPAELRRAEIAREAAAEKIVAGRWAANRLRLYALGAFLLAGPDALLFFICRRFMQLSAAQTAQFLLLDAITGILIVCLIQLGARRGPTGDLTLLAIRVGQTVVFLSAGLTPFHSEVLSLFLFAGLPLAGILLLTQVWGLNLTGLMDLLCQRSGPPPPTPGGSNAR